MRRSDIDIHPASTSFLAFINLWKDNMRNEISDDEESRYPIPGTPCNTLRVLLLLSSDCVSGSRDTRYGEINL